MVLIIELYFPLYVLIGIIKRLPHMGIVIFHFAIRLFVVCDTYNLYSRLNGILREKYLYNVNKKKKKKNK